MLISLSTSRETTSITRLRSWPPQQTSHTGISIFIFSRTDSAQVISESIRGGARLVPCAEGISWPLVPRHSALPVVSCTWSGLLYTCSMERQLEAETTTDGEQTRLKRTFFLSLTVNTRVANSLAWHHINCDRSSDLGLLGTTGLLKGPEIALFQYQPGTFCV